MEKERLLNRLREKRFGDGAGEGGDGQSSADTRQKAASRPTLLEEWARADVRFASAGGSGKLEAVHDAARHALLECIVPVDGRPILFEGGVYSGSWMESTATINAELLARFLPSVAESTYRALSEHQRADGQLPYKVTVNGPAYRQIQMVTPLARCVWHHYRLNGAGKAFLQPMYEAMVRHDEWLVRYRNTRGTGCVEAFGTFDTGHDLSPRFWHVPDTPYGGDARVCDPDSPILPFLAPDLTANVYCQRLYLARMAEELGDEAGAAAWREKAEISLKALVEHCYDESDTFFYDRDWNGELVRIQSDVLHRVLCCEVGDLAFFDHALRRYLLNTRKFFAKYPFTSIAMDDPRFDPFSSHNSWAGPTNFLTLIRTPHAFEHHGRYVELSWVLQPIVSAMSRMTRFSQCLSPWTGAEGYTDTYSPAILGVLDFVERLCGILPTRDGELWFTGLLPSAMDHGETIADETAYSRTADGVRYELVNTRETCVVYADGIERGRFPAGLRVVTDRAGRLAGVVGMTVRTVAGVLRWDGLETEVRVKGNERLELHGGRWVQAADPGVVAPRYS
ncbi:MGH1-like glycoside hydrolase domain-containing protein [Gorillibacterium sp. sgz5001074]|uniref:MGH1-like glycoside hydrolase domain-containing protein n=1 Tax=Gorillibacterium sp. sgz5001074 TaxID=3446695 RepID=UPI003F667B12